MLFIPVGVFGEEEQRRHDHVEDHRRQKHHLNYVGIVK